MKKLRNNRLGFGAIEALIILVIIGLLAGAGWYVYSRQNKAEEPQESTETTQEASSEELEAEEDYGKLTIEETGVSFDLSEEIKDAYYFASDADASFGLKSLDTISSCRAKRAEQKPFLQGMAHLNFGGGSSEYESFKNDPNSSQVADRFFFLITADKKCKSSDPETQKKIEAAQAAFEEAGKTIKIKNFSDSIYNN